MLRKLLIPVLSAVLGILFANLFNPIAWIPGVPVDHVYDICIGLYFALLDVLLNKGFDWVNQKWGAEVTAILSRKGTTSSVNSNPEITVNSSEQADLQITLNLRGKRKHLSGMKVVGLGNKLRIEWHFSHSRVSGRTQAEGVG